MSLKSLVVSVQKVIWVGPASNPGLGTKKSASRSCMMNIFMYRLDLGGSAIIRSDSISRFFYVLELLSILVLLHDDPDILRRPCVCHFRRLQLMSSCYSCIQNLFSRYQTPFLDRKFKQIFLNNKSNLSCDINFKANQ